MLLRLDDVSVRYGRVEVVHGVSLEVGAREIVALTGPNGAGKTTVLRAISGLTPAASGAIALDGRPIERLPTYRIAGLGVAHVPEGRVVFGDQTVEDNLLLGAFQRWFGGDRASIRRDAERLMERFPILGRRRRQLAGLLSGGEQQQLAIARGLMSRPRLLLIDEPSLGLAPTLVEQVFADLAELRAEGVGILVVEQHALRALAVADRGYVLQAGRIRVEGPSADLLRDPAVSRAYLGPSVVDPEEAAREAPEDGGHVAPGG